MGGIAYAEETCPIVDYGIRARGPVDITYIATHMVLRVCLDDVLMVVGMIHLFWGYLGYTCASFLVLV